MESSLERGEPGGRGNGRDAGRHLVCLQKRLPAGSGLHAFAARHLCVSLQRRERTAEDAEVQRNDFTAAPGSASSPLSLGRRGFQAASQAGPRSSPRQWSTGPAGLSWSHVSSLFSPSFSPFLAGFLSLQLSSSLSLWPPAPRPPLPTAHARPGTRSAHRTPFPRRGKGHSLRSEWGDPGSTSRWLPGASLRAGLRGSGRGEGLPGGGVGLGRWGPLPVEEGGPGGPEGSGAPRWVPGQRETARGAPCPGVGAGCSPVTPPGTRTRGHGPVHTAHGRSESKHLKPTPAGHAEGCPVIALCRPGSPWRAGRGPVSRESGPGGLATQHRAGAAQLQGRPLPSPGHAPLLGLPEEPGPPVSGAVWPGTWAARPPWPPALQLVGGSGGVEVGGASGPPGPGREVKLGAE